MKCGTPGLYRSPMLSVITPADEKTHGFNRVDDSPQIFNYVQMYILKISTRYAILNL